MIFEAEVPQKRKRVFGTKRDLLYFRSMIAARESIPYLKSVKPHTMYTPVKERGVSILKHSAPP